MTRHIRIQWTKRNVFVHSLSKSPNPLSSFAKSSITSFGLFQVNIASLNKHIELKRILSYLKYKFDIIGISESMFVEIIFPKKINLIICCIYRYPTSKLSVRDFSNFHLDPVLEKKQCVLMRDFNANLILIMTQLLSKTSWLPISLFHTFFSPPGSKSLIENIFLIFQNINLTVPICLLKVQTISFNF